MLTIGYHKDKEHGFNTETIMSQHDGYTFINIKYSDYRVEMKFRNVGMRHPSSALQFEVKKIFNSGRMHYTGFAIPQSLVEIFLKQLNVIYKP